MHRRRIMYAGGHTHYLPFPHGHCGVNSYSSYQIPAPLPISDVVYTQTHYHDYRHRRGFSHIDYPFYNYAPPILPRPVTLPPILQTTVQNDISYYFNNRNTDYDDDEYEIVDRPSRSRVQLVDLAPKHNRTVLSTFRSEEPPEQILIPRSTLVRHTSLAPYRRARPVRLMPLYHSMDRPYFTSHRRSVARTIIPLATLHTSR